MNKSQSQPSQNGKNKLRVGVFFGGKSAEKEVSLATGRYVLNLLDTSRFQAIPIYMSYSGLLWKLPPKLVLMNTTKDVEAKLESWGPTYTLRRSA